MDSQSKAPDRLQSGRPLALLIAALLSATTPVVLYAQAPGPDANEAAAALADLAPPANPEDLAPEALEELLAPIAIYPDSLLGAMFAASSNPQEVMDAGNWRLQNKLLVGKQLDAAALQAGFGLGTRTLLAFPKVLDMMCQNFEWTRRMGAAFNADQGALMAAVQRLRAQAVEVGNLGSTPEQNVRQRVIDGQQVVEIVPANPRVVYVPEYDPVAVYTTPAPVPVQYLPAPTQPGVTEIVIDSRPDSGDPVVAGLIGFGAGVVIVNSFVPTYVTGVDPWYDPWPCPTPRWGRGYLYHGDQPWVAHGDDYQPRYDHGFPHGYRGGWHYQPPPDYAHGWRRDDDWQRHGERRQHHVMGADSRTDYFNRFGDRDGPGGKDEPRGPRPRRPDLVRPVVRDRVDAHYRPPRPPSVVQPISIPSNPGVLKPDRREPDRYHGRENHPGPGMRMGPAPRERLDGDRTAPPPQAYRWEDREQARGSQPGFGGMLPGPTVRGDDSNAREARQAPPGFSPDPGGARASRMGPRQPDRSQDNQPERLRVSPPIARSPAAAGAGFAAPPRPAMRLSPPAVQSPAPRQERYIERTSPRPQPPSSYMPMPPTQAQQPRYTPPSPRPAQVMAPPARDRQESRPAQRVYAPPSAAQPRPQAAPHSTMGSNPRQEPVRGGPRNKGRDED